MSKEKSEVTYESLIKETKDGKKIYPTFEDTATAMAVHKDHYLRLNTAEKRMVELLERERTLIDAVAQLQKDFASFHRFKKRADKVKLLGKEK